MLSLIPMLLLRENEMFVRLSLIRLNNNKKLKTITNQLEQCGVYFVTYKVMTSVVSTDNTSMLYP